MAGIPPFRGVYGSTGNRTSPRMLRAGPGVDWAPMYRITLQIEQLPEGVALGTSLFIQTATAEEVVRLAPELAADLIALMPETGPPVAPDLDLTRDDLDTV